jgi:glycosyltransferase involved in cell wall biosynthesis
MKFMFFANTDWYLYNFRLSTALHLKEQGAEVVMLSPPGPFGNRFAEHGIRWITLPMMDRASLNPAREALTLRQTVRVLSEERPDLLHNFTVKCAVYGALAAKVARVPAVVNAVAGMGYVFTSDAMMARTLRPVVKVLMRGTFGGENSRVILQNPDDATAFVKSRIVAEHKIRLIRSSGVNTTRFTPTPRGDDPKRPLRVLLAARLLWEKGVREFIDASALVKAQGCEMEFLLAGMPDPGNPRSVDERQVREWVARGLVKWLGHVEDMPGLLRSVDVMALPSYYREGVPKSLIEGAACGLALVTTNLPGCREVVSCHGVDGLHAEPRDAASLAGLLVDLHQDRALLRRLGDSARRKALSDFDEKLVIMRTLEVYDELLGRKEWRLSPPQQELAREAA